MDSGVTVERGNVLVEVLYAGSQLAATRLLGSLGGQINGQAGTNELQALVPYRSLVRLEHDPGILSVRVPLLANEPVRLSDGPVKRSASFASVVGEEVSKTNASSWQAAGITGAGVKVGIVDFFDQAAWSSAENAGEVPSPSGVFCRIGGMACDVWASNATHGEGVAEIIHEMAPDAQIYLATAVTASDLQAVVNYFASQGVRILSRSLTAQYDGKGDGTGPIGQVVDSAVAQGITWFNAAGNSAGKIGVRPGSYWRGSWTDSNGNGWLEWSGTDELLAVPCGADGNRFINGLRWSDWGLNRTDYDIHLYDDPAATIEKSSGIADQTSGAPPIETLSGACTDTDYVAVNLYAPGSGTAGDVLEFQVNGTGLEYWQNAYSAAVPAADSANAGAISVGAIDPAVGTTIASYSSQGPTNDTRTKPDITAASCVSSFTYSPNCFNGTSAATPVTAGAAALVLSAALASSPAQLKSYLLTQAFSDRGAPGTDNIYGVGELVLPAPPSSGGSVGSTYVPLTPARLLDTRFGTGLSDKFTANTPRTFQVTGLGGVPANAVAVTGNFTVTNQTAAGAAFLGPNSTASPATSTLNFPLGDTRANGVTLALSPSGQLSATYLYTVGATTDFIFDVTGYFVPDTTGSSYVPLTPARLLDTRFGTGLSGKFVANTPRTFQVTGLGGVPLNAVGVTGNFTVTNQTAAGAGFLGPNSTATPATSTLNFPLGDTRANGVTLALSPSGQLSATYLYTAGATTDFIFDVTGYFVPGASGAKYVPLTPARLLDTRVANGLSGKFVANNPRTFQVRGLGGVPASAVGVTGNFTVTNQTAAGAAFLGPNSTATPPTSTLNFPLGDTRANGETLALGAGGTLSATYLYTPSSTTDFIWDVTGYFIP